MGLKDLCWCTNSHHPCGPSTTVSTQLICTNLEHKPLSLFHLTAISQHRQNGKKQGCNSPIYPRSTWQTAVHLHIKHSSQIFANWCLCSHHIQYIYVLHLVLFYSGSTSSSTVALGCTKMSFYTSKGLEYYLFTS